MDYIRKSGGAKGVDGQKKRKKNTENNNPRIYIYIYIFTGGTNGSRKERASSRQRWNADRPHNGGL